MSQNAGFCLSYCTSCSTQLMTSSREDGTGWSLGLWCPALGQAQRLPPPRPPADPAAAAAPQTRLWPPARLTVTEPAWARRARRTPLLSPDPGEPSQGKSRGQSCQSPTQTEIETHFRDKWGNESGAGRGGQHHAAGPCEPSFPRVPTGPWVSSGICT